MVLYNYSSLQHLLASTLNENTNHRKCLLSHVRDIKAPQSPPYEISCFRHTVSREGVPPARRWHVVWPSGSISDLPEPFVEGLPFVPFYVVLLDHPDAKGHDLVLLPIVEVLPSNIVACVEDTKADDGLE